jgi:hypothetical protein
MVNITSNLRVINSQTAADKEANNVLAEFAHVTEELTKSVDRMSGFVIVAVDDHGFPTAMSHFGNNFPIPPVMMPEIVKTATEALVYRNGV